MSAGGSRTVRVFLSSTFRDFGEERDLLVRQVFPALRARLKERFVELVDVDLRWGITAEQAERGEVLPICLTEIDRSRPYFIGMLGERYGWVPPPGTLAPQLLARQPWLAQHAGGTSVTELEILHGVLNNPALAGRAFFYFRSRDYARTKAGDYLPASRDDRARQVQLKRRIQRSGFPVVRYDRPETLAARIERDLWQLLDVQFPAGEVPTAAERAMRQHEAYAAPRRRLYLGTQDLLNAMDQALAQGESRILIEGASGGGKSALLANWAHRHAQAHPADQVLTHYLAASSDSADPEALVRRLLEFIRDTTGSTEEIPQAADALFDSMGSWLAQASAWAQAQGARWVFLIDGFNGLRSGRDLRWFPTFVPPQVHLMVSCLPGKVRTALDRKGPWHAVQVRPLEGAQRRELLVNYLATFNKTLADDLIDRVLAHPLAGNPLFLRTLAEELRLFGVYEVLAQRLDHYLASASVEALFEQVLARAEEDFGAVAVSAVMRALWASRAGLREEELLSGQREGLTPLVQATWAPLRHALDDLLIEGMGRIGFAHDYVRQAVVRRYLSAVGEPTATHRALAQWFAQEPPQARRTFEQPYQLREAQDWPALQACLTDREMFRAIHRHRGSQELLGYWLAITRAGGVALADAYQAVWPQWQAGEPDDVLDAAVRLQIFLAFAGYSGPFALELGQQALARSRVQLGMDHPKTIDRISRMAIVCKTRGDLDQAESLYGQALEVAMRVHGETSTEVGTLRLNLAELHRAQGRFVEAEEQARRCLAIQEQAKGETSMAVWSALNTLSVILRLQQRVKEGIPLQTRALSIGQRRRGFEHRDTSISLNNVGLLFLELGQKEEAERAFRKALAMREKLLGPDHTMTGTTRNNLAMLLKSTGQLQEARDLYLLALGSLQAQLGHRHAQTATCLSNLGSLLLETGEWEQARAYLQDSLDIRLEVLGPDHPDVATSLNHLARWHQKQGQPLLALPLRERGLAVAEKALGTGHKDVRTSIGELARLLEETGDLVRAEAVYLRLLELRVAALGAKSTGAARTRERLVALYERQGRLEDAARYRDPPASDPA